MLHDNHAYLGIHKQYDLRHSSFDVTWFLNNNDICRCSNGHVQIIMGTKDYHVQNISKMYKNQNTLHQYVYQVLYSLL
jgi:hypothetical protein